MIYLLCSFCTCLGLIFGATLMWYCSPGYSAKAYLNQIAKAGYGERAVGESIAPSENAEIVSCHSDFRRLLLPHEYNRECQGCKYSGRYVVKI